MPTKVVKFVHWEEDGAWLGYLQDHADYWTQGKTLADLKEHLKDLYRDITSDKVAWGPSIARGASLKGCLSSRYLARDTIIRKVEELVI